MSIDSPPYQGAGAAGYAAPAGRASKRTWRLIPQIDQDPRWVAYVQHTPGRILLACAVAVAVALFNLAGIDFIAALLAVGIAYAGALRRILIPLATLLMLARYGFLYDASVVKLVASQEGVAGRIDQSLLQLASLVLVITLFSGLLISWQRIATIPLFRRSTLCVIATFLGLVVVAQSTAGMPRVLLWSFLVTCLPYLWFLAYALAGAGAKEQPAFWRHLGVFHPFWGSSLTPFGKGLAYLQKFEAKTPEEIAVTQLKGLKLAAWALLLLGTRNSIIAIVHGRLGLPSFDDSFLHHIAGASDPRVIGWISLVDFFIEDLLTMTVFGGTIVAIARLAGFRLLRNTYRPLELKTLAEFWNRYYFYFKELLVDHFFYPTFLRYFRNHRRLRMFCATFAAACVGNLLFHFIRDIHFVAEMGFWNAAIGEQSHAFYTFVLAVSVGISQMRQAPRKPPRGWLRDRLLPCLWVAAFFCVLHFFDAPLDREHTLWQRGEFLLYQLGMTT